MMQQNISLFILTQKLKQFLMRVTLMRSKIYTKIILNIQKYLGKGSGWIIDSAIDHNIDISKYNPLAGSSYIKLPKELDYPKKGLVNIE